MHDLPLRGEKVELMNVFMTQIGGNSINVMVNISAF